MKERKDTCYFLKKKMEEISGIKFDDFVDCYSYRQGFEFTARNRLQCFADRFGIFICEQAVEKTFKAYKYQFENPLLDPMYAFYRAYREMWGTAVKLERGQI